VAPARARVASNRLPTVTIYRFVPAPPVCAARARVSRVCPVCVPAPPGVFFTGTLVGWDACEVRLCDSCVRVCPGSPRCLFTGTWTRTIWRFF
jgi:hypothetical protein